MKNGNFRGSQMIAADQHVTEKKFWINQLAGDLVKSFFPYDQNKIARKQDNREVEYFELDGQLFTRITELGRQSEYRLHIILMAGIILLLNKYTGNPEIIVATPIYKPEIQGKFTNTILPLRTYIKSETTFNRLLKQISQRLVEASTHQNYPIEVLLDQIGTPISNNEPSLLETAVVLENIHQREHIQNIYPGILFSFLCTSGSIKGEVEYQRGLYKRTSIRAIIKHLKHLLSGTVSDVNRPVSCLGLLSGQERKQILLNFSRPGEDGLGYPGAVDWRDRTIHRLLEEQVEKSADKSALTCAGHTLTYSQLNERVNQLARVLPGRKIKSVNGAPQIMALGLKPSTWAVIGSIAILKAGGICLPVYPYTRAQKINIFKENRVSALLTQFDPDEYTEDNFLAGRAMERVVLVGEETIYGVESTNLPCVSQPGDIAYMIYSAGTGGSPKGVLVEHRNITYLVNTVNEIIFKRYRSTLNIGLVSPFTAAVSLMQIFGTLAKGHHLHLWVDHDAGLYPGSNIPNGRGRENKGKDISWLYQFYHKHSLDLSEGTPVHIDLLMEYSRSHSRDLTGLGVSYFILHGDFLCGRKLKAFLDGCGKNQPEITYVYGTAESCGISTVYQVSRENLHGGDTIPAGRPLSCQCVYIMDRNHNLLPPGLEGEIWIAGAAVARGYVNRVEPGKDTFGRDPFFPGQRMFRTGDLGKWKPDGTIEITGRQDRRAPRTGCAAGPEQVEKQLLTHPAIKHALVITKPGETRETSWAAYIVSDRELPALELDEHITRELPVYFIPDAYVRLENIPLTHDWRIDRKALSGMETRKSWKPAVPGDEVEEKLISIWCDVLEVESQALTMDTVFSQLGGQSLKAIMMSSRIHKEFNISIPIPVIFRLATIPGMAKHIKAAIRKEYCPVEPVEKREYYELSAGQKRMYYLQQLDLESIGYNVPQIVRLEGEINREQLEGAIKQMIPRHESLRTSFKIVENEPVQVIHESRDLDFKIEYYDMTVGEEESPGDRVEVIVKNFIKPFDLSRLPLLRAGLVKQDICRYILIADQHHIISDATSRGIFLDELSWLCKGKLLPSLKFQYKDFSQWQNSRGQKQALESQKAFWLKQFDGEIPVLVLPTDYSRPAFQSFNGNIFNFYISREELRELKQIAKKRDVTIFMMLLAIYNIFLSKISGQEDFVVGTPVIGRRHVELERIIGILINTLPLRNYPRAPMTFNAFLEKIKTTALNAYENQVYPFERLVDHMAVKRDISRNPLFDTMFTMQKEDIPAIQIPGLKVVPYHYESRISKFDLTLTAVEIEDRLAFTFEYCTDLFKEETIRRFTGFFKKIVSTVLENHEIGISGIEIITVEAKRQLLQDFNDTWTEYPRNKTIHQLVEEQVEQTPDNIALHGCMIAWMNGGEGSITYKELNEKSNRLARLLQIKGIDADIMAAIMIEPCIEMIVGILAVLKCGTCYLPIDPMNPEERIEYLLTESEAKFLLTHHPFLTGKAKVGIETLNIADERMYTGEARGGSQSVKPGDPVYMIYTSGSTGKPKGVMIKHENLVNYVNWFAKRAGLNIEDRTPLTSSFSFDLGYTSLYSSLLGGGQLHILPRETYASSGEILAYIHRQRISYLKMTPSLFGLIAADPGFSIETCRSLRLVVLGGEAINVTDVEKAYHVCSHIKIMNHYGPTEATIGCIAQFIDPDDLSAYRKRPTIGRPIFNTKVFVLDRYLKPLPAGIPGELCISGAGLARGYLNRPELTAEKFDHGLWDYRDYQDKKKNYKLQNTKYKQIPNYKLQITNKEAPFGQILKATTPQHTTHHSPIYHTGDLARWHPDGNIEFQGRIDHQVKIRGFRIELGEIETLLNRHEAVKEAVVVLYNQKSNPRLVAYVVPHAPRENHSIENTGIRGIRGHLAKHLPDYMVPSAFVILERLPLTASGKTDRRKLSTLPPEHSLESENFVAPRTPGEELLAGIWAEALEVRRVGIHDNFFELGGHSFTAMQVVSRANQAGISLTMRQLFQHHTIDELSGLVNFPDTAGSAELEEEMQIPDSGTLPEIVLGTRDSRDRDIPLSFSQQRCRMYQLANPGITYYNVNHWTRIKGKLDINIVRQSFNEIIRRHHILRTTFPEKNNTPYQVIMDQQEVNITVTDLQNLPGPEHIRQLEKRIKEETERPFDLVQGPLMRVILGKLEAEVHVLGLVMHHMIVDIYSVFILAREFSIIYEALLTGQPCPLPGLTIQYADYAVWQQRYYTREILEDRLRYWEEWLAGKPPRLELPGDRPRPREETYRGGTKRSQYTPHLVREIKKLAKQSGTSFFMTIMAAFMTSLYHYSGNEDQVVAFPILNRNHQVKTVIGMFTATLLLRIDMGGNPSFRELLERVQRASLSALEKQDVPFEHLVKTLRPGWDLSSKPSYRVLLNTAPYYVEPALGIPGLLDITPLTGNVGDDNVMRHDLSLNIAQEKIPAGTNLYAMWRYKKDLFDGETIDRLADHFQFILEEMVKNPEQGVEDFIKDRSLEYQIKETNHESAANIS